jgi:hypothetical protein
LLDDPIPIETQSQRIAWLARAEPALAEGRPAEALAIGERLMATALPAAEGGPGCIPVLW